MAVIIGQPIIAAKVTSVDSALSTTSENPVQNKVITGKVGTATLDTEKKNLSEAVNEVHRELDDLDAALKSGLQKDKDYHLGFYLDENGDLSYD